MPRNIDDLDYPDEVKEAAFVAYVNADRSATKALRHLQEMLFEGEKVPDRTTIAKWAKKEGWDARADDLVASQFPALMARDLARLAMLRAKALRTADDVMEGELDHLNQGQLNARTNTMNTILTISGLGTAGSRVDMQALAPAPKVEALPAGEDGEVDVNALARKQRDRLDALKVQRASQKRKGWFGG